MGGINGVASASITMSGMQLEAACNTALLKKSMESMEQQAMSLIEGMTQAVPAPVQAAGHIDTYI